MKIPLLFLACLIGVGPVSAQATGDGAAPSASAALLMACSGDVKRHQDGKLLSCRLSQPVSVVGFQFPAGSALWFGAKGELARSRLGAESAIYGQPLPAGTELFFASGNRLRHFWLPSDTLLQGHLVRAQDDGAGNRLHPNGKLLAVWLVRDEEIDGVPCTSSGNVLRMGLHAARLGTQRMAWFHDNGHLQQAMLARDVTLQGHSFKQGEVVSLSADGHIDLSAKKLSDW